MNSFRMCVDACTCTLLCVNVSTLHLVVLAALLWEKVIAQHDLQKRKVNAKKKLFHLILDQYTKPSENLATTADVLDMYGCKKEADMLRCKLGFVLMTNMHVVLQYNNASFGLTVSV